MMPMEKSIVIEQLMQLLSKSHCYLTCAFLYPPVFNFVLSLQAPMKVAVSVKKMWRTIISVLLLAANNPMEVLLFIVKAEKCDATG